MSRFLTMELYTVKGHRKQSKYIDQFPVLQFIIARLFVFFFVFFDYLYVYCSKKK